MTLFSGSLRSGGKFSAVMLMLFVTATELLAQMPPMMPRDDPGRSITMPPPGGGGMMNNPPVLNNVAVYQLPGKKFRVTGTVTDETPGACKVTITGAGSGVAFVGANGTFDTIINVATPGGLTLVPNDGVQDGTMVLAAAMNAPPAINGFQAVAVEGGWEFSGTVQDEAPVGLTVTITGLPDGSVTATCMADGTFKVVVYMNPGSSGQANASVTDWYAATGTASTLFGS